MATSKEARKARVLMDRYSFIRIFHEELLQVHPRGHTIREGLKLSVRVQRADPSLMYRKPDDRPGQLENGGYWRFSSDGLATRREYGLFVNNEEEAIRFSNGTQTCTSQRVGAYFEDGFVAGQSVKYILWVCIQEWYEDLEGDPGRYLYTEIAYTVYLSPKSMTFKGLIECSNPLHNVELSNGVMLSGILSADMHDTYIAVQHRLTEICKRFEREVFRCGMTEIIAATEGRGMSGFVGGVKVMSWIVMGRCMINLEAPNPIDPRLNDSFTLMCIEPPEDPNMGYHSIAATADRAEELVNMVIAAWAKLSMEERKMLYLSNENIRLLGM